MICAVQLAVCATASNVVPYLAVHSNCGEGGVEVAVVVGVVVGEVVKEVVTVVMGSQLRKPPLMYASIIKLIVSAVVSHLVLS